MRRKSSTTRSKRKSEPKKKAASEVGEVKEEPEPDTSHFEFLNKDFSPHLLCPECKLLMKSPLRLHPCAHTFCKKCSPSNRKCPQCMSKVTVIQKDLTGEGLVNELTVRCLNDGCPYRGSFEEYKKFHQNSCTLKTGLDEWLKCVQS